MNLFQLVLKQMRQRALSTWLTTLTVLLGVALAVVILIVRREGASLFGQTDYGYDVLVGNKGSPLALTLNTVYHLDQSPGTIPYSVYESLLSDPALRRNLRVAVPFASGDSYRGLPIIGTSPKLFGVGEDGAPLPPGRVLEYRPGQRYAFAAGGPFRADTFEAVVGSEVARRTGLQLGDTFRATHGFPGPNDTPDVHDPEWTVVGVLRPTRTANDKSLFIPLTSFYTLSEHDEGLIAQQAIRAGENPYQAVQAYKNRPRGDAGAAGGEADDHDGHDHGAAGPYTVGDDGRIRLELPRAAWGLSAVAVRTIGPFQMNNLMYAINNGQQAAAVNPAAVMRDFFETFLGNFTLVLLLVSALVTAVAGVGILVSIYNSVAARRREVAVLRALGATRARIVGIICLEAGLIGLAGGLLGLVAGHLLAAAGSAWARRIIGEPIDWMTVGPEEWMYLAGVVVLAVVAGLVPALMAYSTPVATNLAAE